MKQDLLLGRLRVGTSQLERYRLKLEPNETATLKVGIYGKKDCVGGSLVLEYGAVDEIGQSTTFYTRQLRVPFILTVRQALMMKNMDFLSKHSEIDSSDDNTKESKETFERSLSAEDLIFDPQMDANRSDLIPSSKAMNSCNLTFDLQNNWSSSFEIFWDIYEGLFFILVTWLWKVLNKCICSDNESQVPTFTIKTFIHGGMTKRYVSFKYIHFIKFLIPAGQSYSPCSTIHPSKRTGDRTDSFAHMEAVCGEQSQERFTSRRAETADSLLVQTSSGWKFGKKRTDRWAVVECNFLLLRQNDHSLTIEGHRPKTDRALS
jgi:hypothetical protein